VPEHSDGNSWNVGLRLTQAVHILRPGEQVHAAMKLFKSDEKALLM